MRKPKKRWRGVPIMSIREKIKKIIKKIKRVIKKIICRGKYKEIIKN